MSEPNPGTSSFETRLEAMERRLAEIQQELAPDLPTRPVASPASPVPRASPPATPSATPPTAELEPAPPVPAHPPATAIEVSAGPFASMGALREFEQAVAELPGVREVAIRGYETGSRAILEVQLDEETS